MDKVLKFLKDVEELKISFDEIMKQVIDKACKLRAIQTICEEAEENFTILKILFDTQIIDLQSISIEPKYEDDILYLQYYDDKILENKIETNAKKLKVKKKTKIFI